MNILKILIDDEFISINDDEKTSHQFSEYFSIRLGKEELSYEDKNKYGKNIFDTIFSTAQRQQLITDCLNSLTDRENLYLKIISDDEEIHNIPFELININGLEGGYLLKKGNVHICRSILLDDKPVEKIKLPVRILVLISLPLEVYQQAPLDPLKELKNLYDALGDYIDRGLVEIEVEEKVNIPVLKERLLGKQYDIIHFTGHGSEGGYLIIEDEENTDYAKLIDAKSLAEMFAGAGVKLFFFNACQSARGSKITPSVSYHLFKSLPNAYVLANIASVNDREASETTKFIYKTFFENGSVGNVLYKSRLELADDWWKPVFFGAPEIILDSDIKAELKKPAERRIIKRPADVIENYVYRYGIVRKTSDLITKKKYLVLHGIAGAGKSTFAVYISKFFDATFRHHLIFDLKEENLNTPLKLITELLIQVRTANIIDTESFNKLNKEIASDSSKPNVQSKTEEILKLLDRKKLLILDNLENIAQDRSGIINEEWKWFIELLLNHEDVFPVFASRIKLYLTKRKPLENILEIGEYTDAEVGFFWGNLDDTDRNYFEKQYPYIKTVAGNHPLFISKAVEKKFADVGKVLALREFKDYLEFYREYFDEYRGDVEKLFLLDLSFSSEFAENIFSIDFYDQIKNGLLIFNFVEGPEINSFYRIILSYFAGDFIITPEKEILFCNELLKYYKEKIEYKIDVLNILNILINYYKRYNEKAYEEPIVDILNTINFSEYPEFTFFIVEQVSKIISKFSIAEEKLTKSYNNLGLAYNNKGDYEKAIEYYQKALEIEESKLGRDHPDTALSYINLGTAYSNEGDYGKAIENYQKALEITESKLGKDHPDTAASYNNLGTAYLYKGDYNKAIEYHKKALEIRESRLGRDHPDTATTYNDLGRTYSYKGDYDKAIRYYQKALEITESKLGKDHPDTAISYSNLGVAYNGKRDFEKAIEYYQKALEIAEPILGQDHPQTATSYNNLGLAYHNKGNYDKAIVYYYKSLEIRESRLGKDHPDTAKSFNNLGLVYMYKEDYDKAVEYLLKYLDSLRIRLNMVRDINIVSDIIWGEVYLIDCTVKGNLIGQEYFNAVLLEFLHFREQLLTQGFTKYYDEIKNYFIKKKTFNTDSIIKIEAVLQNTKDKMQFKEFIIELNK